MAAIGSSPSVTGGVEPTSVKSHESKKTEQSTAADAIKAHDPSNSSLLKYRVIELSIADWGLYDTELLAYNSLGNKVSTSDRYPN